MVVMKITSDYVDDYNIFVVVVVDDDDDDDDDDV